jgi:carbonic anhydrase
MIDIVYRFDPQASAARAAPATPAEACERLCAGNREFAGLIDLPAGATASTRVIPFDLADVGIADTAGVPPRQQPFAVVLGCSDARVPTELIFNEACNALFVVRVAGNVLGSECLGSIDYAVQHLGANLKLLVVLGHSGCGAVTAAADAFLDPSRYLSVAASHPLRAIVDRLFVAVRAAAQALELARGADVSRLPGYRSALIETAVALNAALTAKTLNQEFRDVLGPQTQVVYGVYHLVTREVSMPLAPGGTDRVGLFAPPADAAEFAQVGLYLAGAPEVARLLAVA